MQALKDVALRLLNVYVSPYVENLNAHDLSLSVFGGNLQFHGLHLKKSLLERFGLPVEIVAGDIGNLSVTIPWTQLKTQPVKINIDNVYVLARARPQGKVDPEEDERVEQATKQERLRSAEAVDSAASQVGTKGVNDENKQTYVGAIISKVVDNVQVHIKNIHVRYEDGTSAPDHPFAAGITLSEFTAVSTDGNWVEAFIQDSLHGVHKLVKLGALSVYFDTDTGSLDKGAEDRQGTLDALKSMLVGSPTHQYILKPVTGEARVIVNKSMSAESPKVDAQVIFDEIGIVFDRDQYRDALSMVDVFHFYRRTHQYHKFRPPEEEFEANPARARLKFALNAIGKEVHERHRRWTWEYMADRRDKRKKYVDAYVKKLALPEGKQLAIEDATVLEEMERVLTYEDIRFFRSVARAQAKKDAATRMKLEAERRKNQPQRQTWGEWIWGVPKADDEGTGMSEEAKKEIDDILDYDAAAPIGATPSDFMKARVSAKLNKGSFSLRVDPHGKNNDIIALVFDSFSADALQLTESVSGKIALGGFRVYDGTTPDSLYPQIVRVKDIENSAGKDGPSRQTSLDIGGTDNALAEISDGMDTQAETDPFFVLEVEQNPLDGHADTVAKVRMRHLEIIYHKGYVEAVVAFFKPPASQLESIGALLDAAGQTLDGIRKETRAGLEYALEQHKTVDLRVDMNAPIIIIPMDVKSKESQALVLDAGHIAVESKLADQAKLKEVHSKRGRQYNDDDFRQLEDLMYDKLSLRLESTQLLMGSSIEACMSAIEDHHASADGDLHIIERINMSFSVQNAIVNAPNLTRFKIQGDLPELQVNFSDRKYKTLMRFIDVAIPKFGDSSPAADAPKPPPASSRPSFRPQKIEEYTLDDTRSIVSGEGHRDVDKDDDDSSVDGKGTDHFYEARDDTTDSQRAALQQVTFEFSFSVGKLQASLFKSTSSTSEKALAEAVLEGFGLTFDLRKYDMSVDLFLRSVTLGMIEQGQLRKPLLTSANEDKGDTDLKLIQVRYVKVQKDSPEFMTVHEGVDQSIDAELSTFNITVAPEPILSLYDFIMTTFVGHDEGPRAAQGKEVPADVVAKQEAEAQNKSSDKIRLRVKLTTVQVSLENNEVRFAVLALPAVDVAIMLRAGTLRIGARLGNIALEDLSDDAVATPEFKKLLSIEGEELADFSYETFDPTDQETFPGYNSSVNLRAGSLKFTFMEKPVRDLYTFATKFARMKAVYDAASQAAVQRASEVTRMHYDVVVKTPIIVLPRDGLTSKDILVLKLGEIVAQNQYSGDPYDTSTIKAGLRGINVASEMEYHGQLARIQMVDDVAITADIKQIASAEHRTENGHADTKVDTKMSDVKLSLTQLQYTLLMELLGAIPRALGGISEGELSPTSTPTTPASSAPPTPADETPEDSSVDLGPELVVAKASGESAPWTSLDLVFAVNSIALELYDGQAHVEADLSKHSIARFALQETNVTMRQLSDGAMQAEFSLKALSFSNTRAGASVFRDIIPAAEHDGKQVMLQYSVTGGSNKAATAIVTIDSPRFILAVDPLAALLEFAMSPFKRTTEKEVAVDEPAPTEEVEAVEGPAEKKGSLQFRVKIVDSTVIVLANDSDPRTQAIQLNIKEVSVAQQNVLALEVSKIGMSFGRMDRPHDRVKFLDELDVALTLQTQQKGSQQLTSFEVEIPDPVIFRASYTDIMLIMDIVNKASAAATRATAPEGQAAAPTRDRRSSLVGGESTAGTTGAIAPTRSSQRRSSVSKRRRSSVDRSRLLVTKEKLKARINGLQFVLVGDLQELPFVHLSTNEFEITANDWSGDLAMATSITTSIRYFNLANSHFEPLMDPWKFNLGVNRISSGAGQAPLKVYFSAAERLEVNLTSAFIELAITTATVWSKESDRIKEGRGNDAPFKIRNRTGLSMMVWPEPHDLSKEIKKNAAKTLHDGAEVPWRFEDRRATRDNVSAVRHNSLGVKLEKCPWTEPLRGISVDREGEHILYLRPKGEVTQQLMCEIRLEHNIKVITFRSTLNIDNRTSHPVEMIVVDAHGKASGGAMKIDPGESCPVPVAAAYDGRFRLRPLKGFGFDYGWSSMIHWTNLMKRPRRAISCKPMNAGDTAFYFQAEAVYDQTDPVTKTYPRLSLTLRAPIEIENLLPYDIKYRIHDKNSGLSSSEFLVKGGTFPVHTVELSHLILLSIAPEDTNLKHSDYAIINTDDVELPIEDHFHLPDEQGLKLMLKLHYYVYPNSGGAKKVQVYSPFIFMNKTGLPFDLAAKTWTGGQKAVAGSDLFGNDHLRDTPTPFMFGFPNEDRRNRLFLRVKNSKWSKPLSFEPVAADMQIAMPTQNGDAEYYVGLSYAEGLGKYKLTKVITIAPRFLIQNNFGKPLQIRQTAGTFTIDLAPGQRQPLHKLVTRSAPQLTLAYEASNTWSAPFNLADIGHTNLTLRKHRDDSRPQLLRIETHIEGSSIFIYISKETGPWPLRFQNDTGLRLSFQQVDRDGSPPEADRCPRYNLEPHSETNYAWDDPTETGKRIQLRAIGEGGATSYVGKPLDVMAIGIQPPIKIGSGNGSTMPRHTISMDIQADGNSQVIVISPYNEDTSVYKPARKRGPGAVTRSDSVDSLATTAFETVAVSEKASLTINVELEGIGVSVITKRPDELVYLSLRGLKVGYSDYPQYYDAFIDCKWIQIDNQLFGGLFPIILYPTVVPKDGKELESHPTLQASVAVLKDRAHGVWFIKYATILLQSMTIELDEDFLFALLDFAKFKDAAWKEPTLDVLIEHPKEIPEPDVTSGTADIFFESLQLQPVALELSFMRTDRVNVDEKVSTRNPFYYAFNVLTMTLGNVNAAPIAFRALMLENSRLSMPSLIERIQLHYQEQAMAQIYRVLGSADFLGNPVGLFNNISSGFSDIFYEPYQGIVMHGNKDIGLGIARGATSFAKKTVFGITDSMTKFTGSIGKGFAAATLDAEFQSKRRMTQRRNKPKHALYGVAAGASAFAESVTSAFEGVASKPIEGAESGGAAGFAKGVGKGFVGLFTKPAVGVMDFLSASTEGIRNTTTVFDQTDIDRVRLPRFIASDGVLRAYSEREALGQSWLKELEAGRYFNDTYVAHLDVPGDDTVAILSNNGIYFIQLRRMRQIWAMAFTDLGSLSLESTGISLFTRDGKNGPFIPISEKSGREWFFRQIGRVVNAYNKAHAHRGD